MLSGSAALRVLLVLVAAAGIAGIVQYVWRGTPAPEPVPAPAVQRPEPRTVRPAEPARPPAETPPPPAPAPAAPPAPPPVAERAPPPPPGAPAPEPVLPVQPDPTAAAEANAGPAALALVDLNTGSLAELNGLRGGGAIGRAIIGHRPYASVDQLLSKRVLSRATYQRIKDQVTVRP